MTLRPCIVCGTPAAGSRCPAHSLGWQRGTRPMPPGWSTLRVRVLREQPVCCVCGVRASTEVDHVLNRARGGTDDPRNLAGICGPCHKRKSTMEAHEAQRAKRVGGGGDRETARVDTSFAPRSSGSVRFPTNREGA